MEAPLLLERTIKVSVIGHSSCGKRAFVKRALGGPYLHFTAPMKSFEFETKYEQRYNESIVWVFSILPGNKTYMQNCVFSLREADAIIVCRDIKADDEDDEMFFREMRDMIREYTKTAPIFAVYTKNDRQSMEYEPYPPNLMKGIRYLGMTSAKLNTGFEDILDKIYIHIDILPQRITAAPIPVPEVGCCRCM